MTEYVFKNKNYAILTFSYDDVLGVAVSVNSVLDMAHAPYSFRRYDNPLVALNNWLDNRYGLNTKDNIRVHSSRDELRFKQNVIKANGLSLSDQYWFHRADKDLRWEDMNFFENEFEYKKFIPLSFTDKRNEYAKVDMLYSPNSTTGGQLEKAWIIDEKTSERCLLKSANTFFLTEPINEVIAYEACRIIGLNATKYELDVIHDLKRPTLMSKCATFITPDTELISASDIIDVSGDQSFEDIVHNYVLFLEEQGVENASQKIQKQLLLDAIMDNTDRHCGNFGVIREVNSLKIIDTAPNFDCGRMLGTTFPYSPLRYNMDEFDIYEFACDVKQEQILNLIDNGIDLSRSQYQKLYDLPEKYQELVEKYGEYTSLRQGDAGHIASIFKRSIEHVESVLEERQIFNVTIQRKAKIS